ncbi:uncharacterized protein A4U43_C02F13080 [Asparagus officinalis]|uniref:Uncharacterized protein n=1 Tax=Asparagus officinalis TaxID=4686 RepID=A0A5P1FIR0_ASPOF|nr:uncharacterized protein A4U43_C02F13080 [Asparagus officinalis]
MEMGASVGGEQAPDALAVSTHHHGKEPDTEGVSLYEEDDSNGETVEDSVEEVCEELSKDSCASLSGKKASEEGESEVQLTRLLDLHLNSFFAY